MKGYGYLISIVSVMLLAIPPLKSAKEDALVLACLIAGALSSIVGMLLRWIADGRTQNEIGEAKATGRIALDRSNGVVAAER